MSVLIGKSTEKILQKVAEKNNLSLKEVKDIYLGYFKGVREEMEKYREEDESTNFAIQLKYIGTFYNHSKKKHSERYRLHKERNK